MMFGHHARETPTVTYCRVFVLFLSMLLLLCFSFFQCGLEALTLLKSWPDMLDTDMIQHLCQTFLDAYQTQFQTSPTML